MLKDDVLEADHIVALKGITHMQGLNGLLFEQQKAVANYRPYQQRERLRRGK